MFKRLNELIAEHIAERKRVRKKNQKRLPKNAPIGSYRPTKPPPPPAPPRPKDSVTEEELREKYPAVQDAWEQYEAMLKLHAGDKKIVTPKPKRKREHYNFGPG